MPKWGLSMKEGKVGRWLIDEGAQVHPGDELLEIDTRFRTGNNGVAGNHWAWDGESQTFVLTPLVYLGGIFYSVHSLPEWWQWITYANPLFYLINGFRYGFLGITDVSLGVSVGMLVVMIAALVAINWYFIRTGLGLKQ